jgi:4-amino-4-deoxy-L-arabinose transferase-like glycosyltransferase
MAKVGIRGRTGRARLRRPAHEDGTDAAALPPARPPLWPAGRAARIGLILLLSFTLLRGLLVAITIPAFWAPDEDYHFLYIEHLTTQHALPSPDRDLYPSEYPAAVQFINYDGYCCGNPPDGLFRGDPKAAVAATSGLDEDRYRTPNHAGRGVGVVHPPLYHLTGAVVNAAGGNASILTRLTWVRFLTALYGVLVVYAAWLLAAQVFASTRLQLLSAFLVSVQPMIVFLAGIVNHDSALIAFSTLALAMLAFMLRSPPRAAQGAWLGGAIVLAALVKGSGLALLPVAALAYLLQWLTNRDRGREVLRSAALAFGLVLVLAGWWYLRAAIVYDSVTGSTTPITGGASAAAQAGASLSDLVTWAKEWTGLTYRTYWFHFQPVWGPSTSFAKFVPVWLGAAGALGLLRLAWRQRRALLLPEGLLLRQLAVMVAAALVFYLPFLAVDLARRADGLGFYVDGGRYLLPAYAAVVVAFLAGVCELVRRDAWPLVLTAIGVVGLAFGVWVYVRWDLQFFMGHEGVGELFRRMTFNRPAFVTEGFVWALAIAIAASLAGFAYFVWRSAPLTGAPRSSRSAG